MRRTGTRSQAAAPAPVNAVPGFIIKVESSGYIPRILRNRSPLTKAREKLTPGPDKATHAMVFLASKEATYITGASLVVDGGNILQEYKGPSENYY